MTDEALIPMRSLAVHEPIYGPDGDEYSINDPICSEVGLKRCATCRRLKLLTAFDKQDARGYLRSRCRSCRNEYLRAHPELRRAIRFRRREKARTEGRLQNIDRRQNVARFGLDIEAYDAILESQGGVCAICGRPCKSGRRLAIDHDHSCCPGQRSCGKCLRGLLCMNCNHAIGLVDDSVEILGAAIDYIQKWRANYGVPSPAPALPNETLNAWMQHLGENSRSYSS